MTTVTTPGEAARGWPLGGRRCDAGIREAVPHPRRPGQAPRPKIYDLMIEKPDMMAKHDGMTCIICMMLV